MEFLKPLFEDQLTAEISDSSDVVVGTASFSPARILKQMEPETYETAFKEWKSFRFVELIEKAEIILNQFDNLARFTRFQETLERSGAVIPFIGAGMSYQSGFKLWKDYLWALQRESHVSEDELSQLLKADQYELAAERLLDDLGERLFAERLQTSYQTTDRLFINGAVNYLPLLFRRAVITTNFDDVIERVYKAQGVDFQLRLFGKDGISFALHLAESKFCLYKVHGDFAITSSRILTNSEYNAAYTENQQFTDTLKLVFSSNTLLFLGCSLCQDRTMQLMKALADERQHLPTHYAFIPSPRDENERRHRQKFLADRSIFPIWYPDGEHDESIEALFIKLLSDRNAL